MSSSLPFTVQDDIEAKEKYAAQQRDKNTRQCSSSRIRLWTLVIIASITTLFLVTYFDLLPVKYEEFSKKAKKILSSYNLKQALEVIEVDLRDDDYQVKMVLKEISDRETFPNIFLNGESLGGSDDLERLHKTGQLTELLNKNQLLIA
ncbi:MAG: hypothetical protein EXX96DRAFT_486298 [Benjaminiella poitrasii]|nr:MAG: hypothetical protein EXX96DRAFT_486298 [Benjaminiella poitrasii]